MKSDALYCELLRLGKSFWLVELMGRFMEIARFLFDEMPVRDLISWNT